MTTRRPLELLHMDLFGPNAYKSLGGNSFGLVIVDDFSRFTWVFFLDDKSQVQKIFKNFARKVMTHKYRGSIVVLSISKSVEPNKEQKEMKSGSVRYSLQALKLSVTDSFVIR